MPSAFSNDFASGPLPALHARFGVSGSLYNDKTQTDVACAPRLQRGMNRQISGKDAQVQGESQDAKIFVQHSEIARPVIGGRFTIDGEVWSITLSPTLRNGQFECTCLRVNPERRGERRASANG